MRVGDIVVGHNPRRRLRRNAEESFGQSIKAKGVMTPVLLRVMSDGSRCLIAGGRRVRHAKAQLGDDYQIPYTARIMTDAEAKAAADIENTQREPMSPIDEADSAADVIAECGGDRDEAARQLDVSPSTLTRRLGLTYATQAVRNALQDETIKLGHAELLATCRPEAQDKIVQLLLTQEKQMSVAECKALLEKAALSLDTAIFDKNACLRCHHNSSNQGALFAETISDGRCTNKQCFDDKTQVEIDTRAKALQDEFQVVKIVQLGEKLTIVPVVADGAAGVGEEQAVACRTCKSFGAVVSAEPDRLGQVFKGMCLNVVCNTKMVAANIRSNQPAQTKACAASNGVTNAGTATKPAGSALAAPTGKPGAKQELSYPEPSQRVKEYREKLWRLVYQRMVAGLDVPSNRAVLLSLALYRPSVFDSSSLQSALKATLQVNTVGGIGELLANVRSLEHATLSGALAHIAANIGSTMAIDDVTAVLKAFQVKLSDYWTISDKFFSILYKNEIDAVCQEIGLKAAMAADYAKAYAGSKDDYIKAITTVEGFDYKGRIPKLMAW